MISLVQVEAFANKVKAPRTAIGVDVVQVLDVLVGILLKEFHYRVGALLFERRNHIRGQFVVAVHLARPPAVAQLHPNDVAVIIHTALFAHLEGGQSIARTE